MFRRLSFLLLILSLGFMVAADGGMSGGGGCTCKRGADEPQPPPPLISVCKAASECASGQLCVDGSCAVPICVVTTDCPAGTYCKSGTTPTCQPGSKSCSATSDCASGEACVNGTCVSSPSVCSNTSDCPAKFYCEVQSGRCLPGGITCSSDSDCPSGNVCTREVCLSKGAAGGGEIKACKTDNDCKEDEACDAGKGLCISVCATLECERDKQCQGSGHMPFCCAVNSVYDPVTMSCSSGAFPTCPVGKVNVSVDPAVVRCVDPIIQPMIGEGVEGAIVMYRSLIGRWNGAFTDLGGGNYAGIIYDLNTPGTDEPVSEIVSTPFRANLRTANKIPVPVTVEPTQFRTITVSGVQEALILRKTEIYPDDPHVRVSAQATDENGTPVVAGTPATFILKPSAGEAITQQVLASDGGVYDAKIQVSPAAFTGQSASISATREGVSVSPREAVTLVSPAARLNLNFGEVGITLPQRHVFQGEDLSLPIEINAGSDRITFFKFEIAYDRNLLAPKATYVTFNNAYRSFFEDIVSGPVSNACTYRGQNIQNISCVTFNAAAKGQASVNGVDIMGDRKLLYLHFAVNSNDTGSAGVAGYKSELRKPGTTPDEKLLGTQNQPILISDYQGSGKDEDGVVRVVAPELRGIFAWATDPDLIDASIVDNSLAAQGSLRNVGVYSDDRSLTSVGGVAYSSSKPNVVAVNGDKYSSADSDLGPAEISLSYGDFSVDGMKVSSQKLIANDPNVVVSATDDKPLNPISGGQGIYQHAQMEAVWTVPGHKNPDGSALTIDLTPWINWSSSSPNNLVVDNTLLKGWVSTDGTAGNITVGGLNKSYAVRVGAAGDAVSVNRLLVAVPSSIQMTSVDQLDRTNKGSIGVMSRVTNGIKGLDDRSPVFVWVDTRDGRKFLAGKDALVQLDPQDNQGVVCLYDVNDNGETCLNSGQKVTADVVRVKAEGGGDTYVTAEYAGLTAKGHVVVELAKAESLEVTAKETRIARNDADPAAAILSLPISTGLKVIAKFPRESGIPDYDATLDPRTTYTTSDVVKSGNGPLVQVSNGEVRATDNGTGKTTITVSVGGIGDIKQAIDIWVMSLESVRIDTSEDLDSPTDFDKFTPRGSIPSACQRIADCSGLSCIVDKCLVGDATFSRVEDKAQYQNGRLGIRGVWTDETESDLLNLNPQGFGKDLNGLPVQQNGNVWRIVPTQAKEYTLKASFTGVGRKDTNTVLNAQDKKVEVTNNRETITTLHLRGTGVLPGAQDADKLFNDTFSGISNIGRSDIRVIAEFADGTRRDVTPSVVATKIEGLISFTRTNIDLPPQQPSGPDDYVGWVGDQNLGQLTIKTNGGIDLEARVVNSGKTQNYTLATNLSPAVGDVDIGCTNGRFVPIDPLNCGAGGYVPVRLEAGTNDVSGFKINIYYNKDVLSTSTSEVATGSARDLGLTAKVETAANSDLDKTGTIILVGTFKEGSTAKGLLEIARIRFTALPDKQKVTRLTGDIISVTDKTGKAIGSSPAMIAGSGWVDPQRGDYDSDGVFKPYDVYRLQVDYNKGPVSNPLGNYSQSGLRITGDDILKGRQILASLFYWVDVQSTQLRVGEAGLSAGLTKADGMTKVTSFSNVEFKVSFGGLSGQPPDQSYSVTQSDASGLYATAGNITGIKYNGVMGVDTKLTVLDTQTSRETNASWIGRKYFVVRGTDGNPTSDPCRGVSCQMGESCQMGFCAPDLCMENGITCGVGKSCQLGSCVISCASDANCVAGEFCLNGFCMRQQDTQGGAQQQPPSQPTQPQWFGGGGTVCTSDAKCGLGGKCISGVCSAALPFCPDDQTTKDDEAVKEMAETFAHGTPGRGNVAYWITYVDAVQGSDDNNCFSTISMPSMPCKSISKVMRNVETLQRDWLYNDMPYYIIVSQGTYDNTTGEQFPLSLPPMTRLIGGFTQGTTSGGQYLCLKREVSKKQNGVDVWNTVIRKDGSCASSVFKIDGSAGLGVGNDARIDGFKIFNLPGAAEQGKAAGCVAIDIKNASPTISRSQVIGGISLSDREFPPLDCEDGLCPLPVQGDVYGIRVIDGAPIIEKSEIYGNCGGGMQNDAGNCATSQAYELSQNTTAIQVSATTSGSELVPIIRDNSIEGGYATNESVGIAHQAVGDVKMGLKAVHNVIRVGGSGVKYADGIRINGDYQGGGFKSYVPTVVLDRNTISDEAQGGADSFTGIKWQSSGKSFAIGGMPITRVMSTNLIYGTQSNLCRGIEFLGPDGGESVGIIFNTIDVKGCYTGPKRAAVYLGYRTSEVIDNMTVYEVIVPTIENNILFGNPDCAITTLVTAYIDSSNILNNILNMNAQANYCVNVRGQNKIVPKSSDVFKQDYHLTDTSPAINSASAPRKEYIDLIKVNWKVLDMDGEERPYPANVIYYDIGADEYYPLTRWAPAM